MSQTSVLFPSRTITISHGRSVVVAKLSALHALEISRLMLKNIEGLKKIPYIRDEASGAIVISRSSFLSILPDLGGAIVELIQKLACRSTRQPEDWLNTLEIEDLMDVIAVAVELNFTEELQKKAISLAKNIFKGQAPESTETPTQSTPSVPPSNS